MKYSMIVNEDGNGIVTGLNRGAIEGETEGTFNWKVKGIYGMDHELYEVVSWELEPKSPEDVQAVKDAREASKVKEEEMKAIEDTFKATAYAPVVSHGYTWAGGLESAMMIDFGVRLAERLNETEVKLYPLDPDGAEAYILFNLTDAVDILSDVALAYRVPYDKMKKDKKDKE